MGMMINRRRYMGKKGAIDYSKQYMTFEVVEGGNITFTASNANLVKTIQYSLDNGTTWTRITSSTTTQELGGNLSVGDKVLVKGTNYAYGDWRDYRNSFNGTAKVNVYGNVLSLIYGDDFIDRHTISGDRTFLALFTGWVNLLSAEHLIMQFDVTKSNSCRWMFSGCTLLTHSPELLITSIASNYAFGEMFNGCTNLRHIKCTTTTFGTYDNYCLSNWVKNVSPIGTFVKHPDATWSTGRSGIPSGWTVEDADI